MKKTILLDVDGVVADFISGLERYLGTTFDDKDRTEWDILKTLTPDLRSRAVEVLAEPEFWWFLPVIDGAQEGVKYLEAVGYEIVWVTSPWDSCSSWESVRRNWLNRHFKWESKKHHYIPTRSKHKVEGDVFVDDKPDNVDEYKAAHPSALVFIFDQPYNRHYKKASRFTWDKVNHLV